MLTHVSTFSGVGGSSEGIRQTGRFETIAAVEIDENAIECYGLNHPKTTIIQADIRTLTAGSFGLARGELDLLEGSPPCSKFSMAGRREKSWNEVTPSDSTTIQMSNVEDLFDDFVSLAVDLMPRMILAENVPAMASGSARGFVDNVRRRLIGAGYRVQAAILTASDFEVPQDRRRLFFVAVRDDQPERFEWPVPISCQASTSVQAVAPWIRDVITREEFTHRHDLTVQIRRWNLDRPAPTIAAAGFAVPRCNVGVLYQAEKRPLPSSDNKFRPARISPSVAGMIARRTGCDGYEAFDIDDIKTLMSFDRDYRLTGSWAQQWQRLGNAVPPLLMKHLAGAVADALG